MRYFWIGLIAIVLLSPLGHAREREYSDITIEETQAAASWAVELNATLMDLVTGLSSLDAINICLEDYQSGAVDQTDSRTCVQQHGQKIDAAVSAYGDRLSNMPPHPVADHPIGMGMLAAVNVLSSEVENMRGFVTEVSTLAEEVIDGNDEAADALARSIMLSGALLMSAEIAAIEAQSAALPATHPQRNLFQAMVHDYRFNIEVINYHASLMFDVPDAEKSGSIIMMERYLRRGETEIDKGAQNTRVTIAQLKPEIAVLKGRDALFGQRVMDAMETYDRDWQIMADNIAAGQTLVAIYRAADAPTDDVLNAFESYMSQTAATVEPMIANQVKRAELIGQ